MPSKKTKVAQRTAKRNAGATGKLSARPVAADVGDPNDSGIAAYEIFANCPLDARPVQKLVVKRPHTGFREGDHS